MSEDTVGAILAGGRSRRMGRTKAVLHVDGIPMAQRVNTALRTGGCTEVAIVGGDADELAVLGLPIVADEHPGEGPVGGLLTALHHFPGRDVLVVACDLPYLTPTAVDRLLSAFARGGADVAVAQTDRVEPMCAVWRSTALGDIQTSFDTGTRALHHVLDGLVVDHVRVDRSVLHNVNAPTDLPAEGSPSPGPTPDRVRPVPVEQISVQALHALGDDIVLIDVREDHEWAESHVPHAVHIPLGTVPEALGAFVGSPTYVICRVGGRSQHACEIANGQGKDVVNVAGGMVAWTRAGFATESGN